MTKTEADGYEAAFELGALVQVVHPVLSVLDVLLHPCQSPYYTYLLSDGRWYYKNEIVRASCEK